MEKAASQSAAPQFSLQKQLQINATAFCSACI